MRSPARNPLIDDNIEPIILGIVALVAAVAAITGLKPKGTRHVAHTKLMTAARVTLVITLIVIAVVAFRGQGAG